MPSFEAKGVIINISDLHVVSDRFQKREFVLRIDEQYPQEVMFQMVQDNCSLLDQFKTGDLVKIRADVRGRKWQKTPDDAPRWFNTLQAFKIEGEAVPKVVTPEEFTGEMPEITTQSPDTLPF